jgi:hypothetical protein
MNASISHEIEEVTKIPEAGTNGRLPASNRGAPECAILKARSGMTSHGAPTQVASPDKPGRNPKENCGGSTQP